MNVKFIVAFMLFCMVATNETFGKTPEEQPTPVDQRWVLVEQLITSCQTSVLLEDTVKVIIGDEQTNLLGFSVFEEHLLIRAVFTLQNGDHLVIQKQSMNGEVMIAGSFQTPAEPGKQYVSVSVSDDGLLQLIIDETGQEILFLIPQ